MEVERHTLLLALEVSFFLSSEPSLFSAKQACPPELCLCMFNFCVPAVSCGEGTSWPRLVPLVIS